jgi:2-polyprenyl-3-methyl-5-hydroxy-6-metoxy-1,4-benzoquinol methylase
MSTPLSPITVTNDTILTDTYERSDIIKLYKDRFNMDVAPFFTGGDTFYLYQCRQTGYRFYYPAGMDGDGNFYAILQQRLGDEYYHDWKFENQLALDHINTEDRVLDIGCGIGKFLDRAKDKAKEVTGLELNEKAVAVCREKGLSVFNEMIGDHAIKKPAYYDMVCMFQVLEHIYDVKGFLDDALKVLKPGGKLVIGVPNNEPYFQGYDKYCTLNLPPHHMGLWNRQVFENTAPLFNLKIQEVAYDMKGRTLIYAYLKAKYLAKVKSEGGKHTLAEKIKMLLWAPITVPSAIIKKITRGINGSHFAVVFEKQ